MSESGKVVFRASRYYIEEIDHRQRDGSIQPRKVIRHPGAVAIVPVLEDGRICLIRNRRFTVDKELLEVPAGTRERGEDPQATAARELTEETGYHAEHWRQLHEFYLAPGVMDERVFLFLAEGLTAGPPQLEQYEFIENHLVTLEEAVQMCRDGRIEDSKTLVGVLTYANHLQAKDHE